MRNPNAPISSLLGSERRPTKNLRVRDVILGFGIAVLAVVGGVYAWPVVISSVDLSFGTTTRIDCAAGTEIIFEHGIDAAENTVVTSVRLTGVDPQCDDSFVALALYNASGGLVDEIVWSVSVFPGDTSVTLVADGTTTSSSNTSNGTVSEIYPNSQTDPEGYSDNASVTSIADAEIITLSSNRAARD